jgi:hypothetical protein
MPTTIDASGVTFPDGTVQSSANISRELTYQIRTGNYYTSFLRTYQSATTLQLYNAAGLSLWATAFVIPRPITVDRIGVTVTTAATSGVLRLGIYNNGTNNYPGSLVLDAGTIDASTTGWKEIIISQSLATGVWWLACLPNLDTIYIGANEYYQTILGSSTSTDYAYATWKVVQAYGTLPATFPTGGDMYNRLLDLGVRVSALG